MAHTREKSDIETIRDLIKDIRVAMLTTVDEDGSLRSRPMATQKEEFDGELWFFTSSDTPKTGEIERDHRVNVSYADPGDNRFVSLSGTARVVRDKEKAKELWNPLLKAWFPQGLDEPDLVLLNVRVEKAEYWDSPSSKMVQLVGLAKALATGHRYHADPGEHDKVELAGAKRG